jgi:TolA-binding protein
VRSAAIAWATTAMALAFGASGCFAMQHDQDLIAAAQAKQAEDVKRATAEVAALRADLEATRERLDNALRANADNGSDLMGEKTRLNQFAGRIDEVNHSVDELGKTVASMRTELGAQIDDLKRAQAVQATPAPPPVVIPADKGAHFAAFEAACKAKDWALARTLGHEYVGRYATDDKADDVLYLMGDADLQDARPASALGEFNRILKQYPRSNLLDRTLFGMGEAYDALHDCANAKLAFQACEGHFPREKLGAEAKKRIQAIDKLPAGSCAPP